MTPTTHPSRKAACWRWFWRAPSLSVSRPMPARGRSRTSRRRGVISLCAPPNALPFASKRGDRPGYQIDLAQALADRLGVRLRGRLGDPVVPLPPGRLRHRHGHDRRSGGAGREPAALVDAVSEERRGARGPSRGRRHHGLRQPERAVAGRRAAGLARAHVSRSAWRARDPLRLRGRHVDGAREPARSMPPRSPRSAPATTISSIPRRSSV